MFHRLIAMILFVVLAAPASAVRLKDIASFRGVRANQLTGYGLVVGLKGTGDKNGTEFTVRSLASVLARMGIGVDADQIQVKNVAAVVVTASLPPFARTGSRIDSTVSSLGDATSLEGGTLIMTPLFGADGEVYAIAQGSVSVGGFSAGGGGGSSVSKNHTTVGRLAGGATIERELSFEIDRKDAFDVALAEADFTTARRIAKSINRELGEDVAIAPDPGTVRVQVPAHYRSDVVGFLAAVESIEVDPDQAARVVLNERTGTVVMGQNVSISKVAISHGSLSVTIRIRNDVSQPLPFSEGETTEVVNDEITAVEEDARLTVIDGPVTIDELVRGLNAMGVTPRDLISILQAIKAAGALSAEIQVM
ncbi:MAG: flagellar basal body P-ring protein FlgI [bacterium]|nr:flagellar basal body P-ring protein FlgI [bacterium]MCP5067375.1 flagellar basal body P-ring protein FlgI [bacterium]